MSSIEKLRKEIKCRPNTFDWHDVKRIIKDVGYVESKGGKTSGSRVRFTHTTAAPIVLHKPHPGNEMKSYAIRLVVDMLEAEGLL